MGPRERERILERCASRSGSRAAPAARTASGPMVCSVTTPGSKVSSQSAAIPPAAWVGHVSVLLFPIRLFPIRLSPACHFGFWEKQPAKRE